MTMLALIIGGLWAYIKFVYRREQEPRAEFDVDLNFVGIQNNHWLIEASAYVENKGSVRHPVRNFKMDIHYLLKDEQPIEGDKDINFQVKFSHSIKRTLSEETYIDPQLRYRNSYITVVPTEAAFVLVFSKFEYKKEKFTAQRLFKVPSEITQGIKERPLSRTQ